MRLDRFVSQAAGISRSQARALLRRGEIEVDGEPQRDVARVLRGAETVCHHGQLLALPQPLYLMLHKPCGLLSVTSDRQQPTVLSLLPDGLARRVHPVGRLDKDTSGLLLLSDDGAWSHRVTSPRHGCSKVYLAELAEPLVADAERRLAAGVQLRSEPSPSRPAGLQRVGPRLARITVSEGRYHLVRRLFAALGNRVLALHRERIGGLALDDALPVGHWRALTEQERCRVLDAPRQAPAGLSD